MRWPPPAWKWPATPKCCSVHWPTSSRSARSSTRTPATNRRRRITEDRRQDTMSNSLREKLLGLGFKAPEPERKPEPRPRTERRPEANAGKPGEPRRGEGRPRPPGKPGESRPSPHGKPGENRRDAKPGQGTDAR